MAWSVSVLCFLFFAMALPAGATAPGVYATAGVLQKDGIWEVGVTFDDTVNPDSTPFLEHYKISPIGSIEGLRMVPQDGGIVLSVTGLVPDAETFLTITNLTRKDGSELPVLNLMFTNRAMSWAAIGSQELGFPVDAVAVGENGFDLVSGGYQLFDNYDEATFVYEKLAGDFDKHVRVDYQDPSSIGARAGLMVRETLDAGKPRPADPSDPADAFSRYLEVHVTPVDTGYGEAASNTHEVNIRYYLGGIGSPNPPTEQPALTNNAAPAYTNAWLRIKRTGQVFEVYRGTNGMSWEQMGSFTFPTNADNGPFPQTVFFGPSYSPENGNIPVISGARAAFLAKFRDYGGIGSSVPKEAPPIRITKLATGEIEISWTGQAILQTNTVALPTGWVDITTASPYRFTPPPGKGAAFFRLRV